MKRIALAAIIGLSVNGLAYADVSDLDNYLAFSAHDISSSSAFEAPGAGGLTKNQQQEDDLIHGYRNVVAAQSEAPDVSALRKNQQQEDDLIHGYRK